MRGTVVIIILVLLAGCASSTDLSEAAFIHSYDEGSPRAQSFDLPSSVSRLDVHIEITGQEDALRCAVREAPIRAALLDPTSREVVSVEVDGAPLATGGNACTATNAQKAFDARGGSWTVSFSGAGDLRASVRIEPIG